MSAPIRSDPAFSPKAHQRDSTTCASLRGCPFGAGGGVQAVFVVGVEGRGSRGGSRSAAAPTPSRPRCGYMPGVRQWRSPESPGASSGLPAGTPEGSQCSARSRTSALSTVASARYKVRSDRTAPALVHSRRRGHECRIEVDVRRRGRVVPPLSGCTEPAHLGTDRVNRVQHSIDLTAGLNAGRVNGGEIRR